MIWGILELLLPQVRQSRKQGSKCRNPEYFTPNPNLKPLCITRGNLPNSKKTYWKTEYYLNRTWTGSCHQTDMNLCKPPCLHAKLIGVIFMVNRKREISFSPPQLWNQSNAHTQWAVYCQMWGTRRINVASRECNSWQFAYYYICSCTMTKLFQGTGKDTSCWQQLTN